MTTDQAASCVLVSVVRLFDSRLLSKKFEMQIPPVVLGRR